MPIVAVIAIALLAACSAATSGRAPAGPTVSQTIDEQIAREGAMRWAPDRRLVWTDFRGPAPANAGAVAAETAYTLIHGAGCTGSRFEFRVATAFRPNTSWVKPAMFTTAADSARALRHEQTHFDLAEVHARRLRRYYAELIAPCQVSEDDLTATANRITQNEKAAQAQYDAETDFGRNPAQQTRWDKDVAEQLLALAKFAR